MSCLLLTPARKGKVRFSPNGVLLLGVTTTLQGRPQTQEYDPTQNRHHACQDTVQERSNVRILNACENTQNKTMTKTKPTKPNQTKLSLVTSVSSKLGTVLRMCFSVHLPCVVDRNEFTSDYSLLLAVVIQLNI